MKEALVRALPLVAVCKRPNRPELAAGDPNKEPGNKRGSRFAPCIVGALLLAFGVPSHAQQPTKVPRIGFLSGSGDPSTRHPSFESFRQALRDLGYIEEKTIQLEPRYAQGDRVLIPSLVAELVQAKVDVFLTGNLTAIRAAKQMTRTMPIVMVTTVDPIATGLIDSLSRPGGNITGLTSLSRDLSTKRLELLKELVPNLSRVAILWDKTNEGSAIGFEEYETGARALKLELQSLGVRGPDPDLESAVAFSAKWRANALIPIRSTVISRHLKRIAQLAIKHRLPSLYDGSNSVEVGGLMSYSTDDAESFRRAAIYVDKILKGGKPAELPVEQLTRFELIINLQTAKQIGLTVPDAVLYRADRVIR